MSASPEITSKPLFLSGSQMINWLVKNRENENVTNFIQGNWNQRVPDSISVKLSKANFTFEGTLEKILPLDLPGLLSGMHGFLREALRSETFSVALAQRSLAVEDSASSFYLNLAYLLHLLPRQGEKGAFEILELETLSLQEKKQLKHWMDLDLLFGSRSVEEIFSLHIPSNPIRSEERSQHRLQTMFTLLKTAFRDFNAYKNFFPTRLERGIKILLSRETLENPSIFSIVLSGLKELESLLEKQIAEKKRKETFTSLLEGSMGIPEAERDSFEEIDSFFVQLPLAQERKDSLDVTEITTPNGGVGRTFVLPSLGSSSIRPNRVSKKPMQEQEALKSCLNLQKKLTQLIWALEASEIEDKKKQLPKFDPSIFRLLLAETPPSKKRKPRRTAQLESKEPQVEAKEQIEKKPILSATTANTNETEEAAFEKAKTAAFTALSEGNVKPLAAFLLQGNKPNLPKEASHHFFLFCAGFTHLLQNTASKSNAFRSMLIHFSVLVETIFKKESEEHHLGSITEKAPISERAKRFLGENSLLLLWVRYPGYFAEKKSHLPEALQLLLLLDKGELEETSLLSLKKYLNELCQVVFEIAPYTEGEEALPILSKKIEDLSSIDPLSDIRNETILGLLEKARTVFPEVEKTENRDAISHLKDLQFYLRTLGRALRIDGDDFWERNQLRELDKVFKHFYQLVLVSRGMPDERSHNLQYLRSLLGLMEEPHLNPIQVGIGHHYLTDNWEECEESIQQVTGFSSSVSTKRKKEKAQQINRILLILDKESSLLADALRGYTTT